MRYHDSYLDAQTIAKAALAFLDKHGLAHNPIHYAIAYQHISETNAQLSKALSGILDEHSPDPYEMEILFDKYISENKPKSEKSIENLNKCIEHLETVNGESGTAVDQLEHSIDQGTDTDSTLISNIISAAKTVRNAQEKVNKQLAETRQQSDILMKELETARALAITDSLTKLKNRSGMDEYLAALPDKSFKQFCVAIADIDHFKQFNDEFGHLVGDLILKRLGKLFVEELPVPCQAFRFGGEEFVILMPECNLEQAIEVAERFRIVVAHLRFKNARTKKRLPPLTISLGVTGWVKGDDIEHALMRADQALYQAKDSGRNKVCSIKA
ncbi:GGDEF domain-containing protein [Planctobacterium marinum]|uniref:diguanylate cyclase n=1 Tax=Planctobacterium marinum TaxID=1631968 RepID=A0AA48KSS8_9ALTE|nr:diguanylate cyclase [Planctobacterium marinum]